MKYLIRLKDIILENFPKVAFLFPDGWKFYDKYRANKYGFLSMEVDDLAYKYFDETFPYDLFKIDYYSLRYKATFYSDLRQIRAYAQMNQKLIYEDIRIRNSDEEPAECPDYYLVELFMSHQYKILEKIAKYITIITEPVFGELLFYGIQSPKKYIEIYVNIKIKEMERFKCKIMADVMIPRERPKVEQDEEMTSLFKNINIRSLLYIKTILKKYSR